MLKQIFFTLYESYHSKLMPNKKRSHEDARKAVCLLCFGKTKFMRNITPNINRIIKEFVLSGYDDEDIRLPVVLCSSCYTTLCDYGKEKFNRRIDLFDHSTLTDRIARPSSNMTCLCKVCDHAKASTSSNLSMATVVMAKKPRGRPSNEPYSDSSSCKRPYESIKICSRCFATIGRGKPHECSSRKRHSNLLDIASSPVTKEKFVSSMILERKGESGSDNSFSFASGNGKSIKLVLSPSNTENTKISCDDMHKIQNDMNLTTNQTHKLGKHIRSAVGNRTVIECNLKERLREKNHRLDNHFKVETLSFVVNDGNGNSKESRNRSASKHAVVCNSVKELFDIVTSEREYDSDIRATVGIDSGGEFLKICLTVQPCSEDSSTTKMKSCSFRDSGVKKLLILAAVKNIPENYKNVLTLWSALTLTHDFDFLTGCTYAMDLKMANIMLGLMAHSSSHPCSWCNIHKNDLGNQGELRTLGSLRQMYWNFFDAGKNASNAKNFENVVHPPIFKNSDDTLVLDIIPPPELHLLLGAVNALYIGLNKVWPECQRWADAVNVTREAYHGGSFTGNSCRKLLKGLDVLQELCPSSCTNFVLAFQSLREVVESSFSKTLYPDYVRKITTFKESFEDLGINITPKLHAIFFHIKDFCSRHPSGLGNWSEQSFESVHQDFHHTWMKYKVPDQHEKFPEQLLRAVTEYNSRHL